MLELGASICRIGKEQGEARITNPRDNLGDCSGAGGGCKGATHILEFFDRVIYARRIRDEHPLRGEAYA